MLLDTVEVVLSLSDKQSGSGVDRLGIDKWLYLQPALLQWVAQSAHHVAHEPQVVLIKCQHPEDGWAH